MSTLSAKQVACLAIQAGFTGAEITQMVVIAKLESGFRTDARNPIAVCTGSACGHATGLFQIVDFPDRVAKYGDLTDPVANTRAAYDIRRSQGLAAWTTWTSAVAAAVAVGLQTGGAFGINLSGLPTDASQCGGSSDTASNTQLVGIALPNPFQDATNSFLHALIGYGTGGLGLALLGVSILAMALVLAPGTFEKPVRALPGLAKAALMVAAK